jgi:magnesium-transporting ATPase (P-type)
VMITGDKLETAENIGYLSNFISQTSKVFRLREVEKNYGNELFNIFNQLHNSNLNDFSVLIEGMLIK